MIIIENNEKSVETVEKELSEPAVIQESKLDEFSKTATAAKLSGAFHETSGFLKRKIGELTKDASLKDAGREQQLLGKVHRLVGTIRSVREVALSRISDTGKESLAICRKHSGRIVDVASDLVDDIKKTLLK